MDSTPPTSVEKLANIKVDDDVKLVRDGGLLAKNHPYAHSMLENLMEEHETLTVHKVIINHLNNIFVN